MRVRIRFNGKEYASLGEMPPEERRRYEEVVQSLGPLLSNPDSNETTRSFEIGKDPGVHATVRTRIVVNGQTYNSPDELPPDLRRHYEEAMRNAGTGKGAPGKNVTISVVRREQPTGFDPQAPGIQPGPMFSDPDPGAIVARFTGRVLLAAASLFAIGVAAWLLFSAGIFGRH